MKISDLKEGLISKIRELNYKKNYSKKKKIGVIAGFSAAAIIAGVAIFVNNGQDNQQIKAADTDNTAQVSVEKSTAKTTNAVQMYKFTKYQKAAINEYDLSSKSEKGSEQSQASPQTDTDFTVKFPETDEEYRDDKPDAMNFTETRSIADEYYTVYDERSGKYVTMNGHEIVCRIVRNEVGDNWDENAVKAQAVAAYCYLRYGDDNGYIRQVGLSPFYSSYIEKCVSEVEGQAVYCDKGVINGVYSASTAGYSTASVKVWGGNMSYLQPVVSQYDNLDPHWQDKTVFTKEQVKEKLENSLNIKLSDNVKNWFRIDDCYSVRYIKKVTIDGQKTISGVNLCQIFGVKSNAMDISYKDGEFTVATYGWGHGVGLSQWGARLYAEHGWTYDQILRHYYVGTTLQLSTINEKAVARGKMTEEERQAEVERATGRKIKDEDSDAIETVADKKDKSDKNKTDKSDKNEKKNSDEEVNPDEEFAKGGTDFSSEESSKKINKDEDSSESEETNEESSQEE